jgi:membrane-bound serine protease (ClpP class)
MIKRYSIIFLLLFACLFVSADISAGDTPASIEVKEGGVYVIPVNGVINPVSAEFIHKALEKASAMKAAALVIELDTPGGLDTSMRSIVKDIMGSSIPIVVYVSPAGARAASAGVFIMLAAHVAAMSPGSNIGAAHPVSIGEKMDKVMAEKATNDAAAYIKSIAEQRGRNSTWAQEAVKKSISATETEALKNGIIDLVAKDVSSLLKAIDGRKVKVLNSDKTLSTANAKVVTEKMGLRLKILNIISDPSIAYILMLLGFYGLFFELTNPGALLPGIIGAISLVVAFYAFQTLPVNYAGLLLIVIGIILFLLEVKVTSYGLLTVSGALSVALGSLMLFDSPSPFLRISLSIIIPATVVTALFFVVTFRLAYKAHKRKPVTGGEGLVGLEGITKTEVGPEGGMVRVHGEFWSASSDKRIGKNEPVIVETVSGLKLRVRSKQ